jgi:hypothetical protein
MPATMTKAVSRATEILIRVWERHGEAERSAEQAERDGNPDVAARYLVHRDAWGAAFLLLANDGTARDAVPFTARMETVLALARIEGRAAHLRCLGETTTPEEETDRARVHAWADVVELMDNRLIAGAFRDDVRRPLA